MIQEILVVFLFILGALLAFYVGIRSVEQMQLADDILEEKTIKKSKKVSHKGEVCWYIALGVLMGLGTAYTVGLNLHLFPLWIAFVCIGASMYVDRKIHIIPNVFPLTMLGFSTINLLLEFLIEPQMGVGFLVSCSLGGVLSFVLMFLVSVLSHGGVGMGDVKLLGALGALCGGVCVLNTLLLSTILAAIAAIFLLVRKKVGWKYTMPFGPFLFIGYMLTVILGVC